MGDTFYEGRGLTNNTSISEGRMRIVNKEADSKLKEQIIMVFLKAAYFTERSTTFSREVSLAQYAEKQMKRKIS